MPPPGASGSSPAGTPRCSLITGDDPEQVVVTVAVHDHLKSAFGKVGVGSRGELVV
ncbi:MAG: hypothetical protein ABI568_01825 [Pseudarthrobacter sp.]